MTLNYPGPYEMRFFYTVDTTPGGAIEHQLRFSCDLETDPDPGDTFTGFNLKLSGGGVVLASTCVNNTIDKLEDLFNSTDADFTRCELWKYDEGTFDATYVTAMALTLPGTSVTATNPAGETIMTCRTKGGGIFKICLEDTVGDYGPPAVYADCNALIQAAFDYFCHLSTAPFMGRDGTYPFLPLKMSPGQNENLFKKRYGR